MRDVPEAVARAVRSALAAHEGDVLAFLPGMGEIRRAEASLAGCGALVLPLHGDLPPGEQDRALRPAPPSSNGGRRVVLATSIAETSLTVPGVRIVVDGGWRRSPRLDAATGLTRLATLRVSRAAADQRAGRAGREGPGVAIRLWTAAQHRGLAPYDRPAILEAELSGLLLDCAAWGTPPGALPFPDAPPAGALAAAGVLLASLGALDPGGRITASGAPHGGAGRASPAGGDDADGGGAGAGGAGGGRWQRCWRSVIPLRGPDAPADMRHRLEALAGGGGDADRGAVSRIRQQAAAVPAAAAGGGGRA